jgi:hypothetical protein
MQKELKQLKATLIKFDVLHTNHINAFDTQTHLDLDTQMNERKAEFTNLMKHFNIFIDKTENINESESTCEVEKITKQISQLMHKNKTLKLKIQTHRDELGKSIKQITRGRQAIHAYGTPESYRNRSKVLNFKN